MSERLRRFGRAVLVGDLVVRRENADLLEKADLEEGGAVEQEQDGGNDRLGDAEGEEESKGPDPA